MQVAAYYALVCLLFGNLQRCYKHRKAKIRKTEFAKPNPVQETEYFDLRTRTFAILNPARPSKGTRHGSHANRARHGTADQRTAPPRAQARGGAGGRVGRRRRGARGARGAPRRVPLMKWRGRAGFRIALEQFSAYQRGDVRSRERGRSGREGGGSGTSALGRKPSARPPRQPTTTAK